MTLARLAIMVVAGSFALTAFTMLAAIGIHNAFEWWGSESARELKSLPRTFIRWIEGRNWPFRRAPRTLVTVRWATVDEILSDEGVRREIIEALDRESPFRRTLVHPGRNVACARASRTLEIQRHGGRGTKARRS